MASSHEIRLRLTSNTIWETVITDAWLHPDILDQTIELDVLTLLWADRTQDTDKKKGGGLCVLINDVLIHDVSCSNAVKVGKPDHLWHHTSANVWDYITGESKHTVTDICINIIHFREDKLGMKIKDDICRWTELEAIR